MLDYLAKARDVLAVAHNGANLKARLIAAFPDHGGRVLPDYQRDKVAARFTMRSTHRGTFFGVSPTGNPIVVQSINFYRLSGGQFDEVITLFELEDIQKAREFFDSADLHGKMQQAGTADRPDFYLLSD